MPLISWLVTAILSVIVVVLLLLAVVRIEKPIKQLITSGIQGLCALGLVNALGGATGVSLGFSWLTMGVSALLGMPGVIGLLTVTTIMNM